MANGCATPHRKAAPLPVAAPFPTADSTSGFYHTVERGQTFYRIAKVYSLDPKELMRANGVSDPGSLEIGQRLFIPRESVRHLAPTPTPQSVEEMERWIGPRQYVYPWRTLTVHHSATTQGSAKLFDRDHRRRRMGGLFYHFVIGNGSYSKDGEVEIGWRWKKQVKANRHYDVQICLVGDFNRQRVSEAQFHSLTALIRVLRNQYGIPVQNIRKHEDIKGKHTECPGRHFPFEEMLSAVDG